MEPTELEFTKTPWGDGCMDYRNRLYLCKHCEGDKRCPRPETIEQETKKQWTE